MNQTTVGNLTYSKTTMSVISLVNLLWSTHVVFPRPLMSPLLESERCHLVLLVIFFSYEKIHVLISIKNLASLTCGQQNGLLLRPSSHLTF